MSFITEDELNKAVQDIFHKDIELIPSWNSIIRWSVEHSFRLIVQNLAKRGFSYSQILQWDDGALTQIKLGKYLALTHLSAIEPELTRRLDIKEFDCTDYLQGKMFAMTIGNVVVSPDYDWDQTTYGNAGTYGDYFNPWDDPQNDPRIGQFTKF